VSDLHADETPLWVIASAIDIVRRAAPDIITLTGDYVSATLTFQQEYLKARSRLARIAPTFAVMGNHDGGTWAYQADGYRESGLMRRFVEKAGIPVLHNRQVEIHLGDRQLQLIGLGDLWSGEFEPEYAFQSSREDQPTVVLSHNPDSKSWIKSWHWNLMLSGHTHGGPLIVPLSGETPLAPQSELGDMYTGLRPGWTGTSRSHEGSAQYTGFASIAPLRWRFLTWSNASAALAWEVSPPPEIITITLRAAGAPPYQAHRQRRFRG
jgi:predicted MPP superfamily phosphohydrolase